MTRKTYLHLDYHRTAAIEDQMEVLREDDDEPQEDLTELELRSIKKELRQMQRKAEGTSCIRERGEWSIDVRCRVAQMTISIRPTSKPATSLRTFRHPTVSSHDVGKPYRLLKGPAAQIPLFT